MRRAWVMGLVGSALLSALPAAAQVPAGGEFLVKSTPFYSAADVAVDPSGGFVVVWNEDDGTSYVLNGQRFDARGARRGAEFSISAGDNDFVYQVAAFPSGRFVVGWWRSFGGLFARIFDASGVPVGPEFNIAPGTGAADRLSIAVTSPSTFVATWSALGDGSQFGVFARRFDVAGNAVSGPFVVNAYTSLSQDDPSVAAAADGGFVIVWASTRQDGASTGVFGRRFDAAGQPLGTDFSVNTYTTGFQDYPKVGSDPGGNFVVVWENRVFPTPGSIVGRTFDSAGLPAGPEFVVTDFFGTSTVGYSKSVASDRAGNFTVAWSNFTDGDGFGVRARRYTADGLPRGAVFQVNSNTAENQGLGDLVSDGAGNLVALWMTVYMPPPPDEDIVGQRFGGLLPAALSVADDDNTVLEVGDTFALGTAWRNVNGAAQTFQGRSSDVVVPAGLSLALSTDADYGTLADGAVAPCIGPCFAGTLSGQRPMGHVDARFLETIAPDSLGQVQRWTLHVGDSFTDVPRTSGFYRDIETLLHRGVTAGCAGATYCPLGSTTREQMSVFVLVAKEGAGYSPPACTAPVFADVPASSPFCPWIEELARRGVTSGCGGGNYCPTAAVSREQMAVFVLRTLDPTLTPPACAPPNIFNDVPETSAFCPWIEELSRRGVVSGCGGGNYCPAAPVTREQMAVFLTGTFGLTLYGP